MSISIYQNLKDISIELFSEILTNGNTLLLIKDYDSNAEYSDEVIEKCGSTWVKLFDEYFMLKNDGRARNSIKKHSETGKLFQKMRAIELCVSVLGNLHNISRVGAEKEDVLIEMKQKALRAVIDLDPRIKINVFDDYETIINRLIKINNSYLNEFNLIEKRVKQEGQKARNSIYQSIVDIQNVLGYSLGDVKAINVPMFIALEKSAVTKSNAQKNNKK